MTIIDTTLYANGALRLSRHGAGRGGTVLMHVPSGKQIDVPAEIEDAVTIYLPRDVQVIGADLAFATAQGYVKEWKARRP